MSSFTYIIINVDSITEEQIKNSRAMNRDSLRKSIDETKYLIKTSMPSESCYDGIQKYTNSEIFTILESSDWKAAPINIEDYK